MSRGLGDVYKRQEDNLGVVISPSEVTREDMDTPEKIIALVEAKAQEK